MLPVGLANTRISTGYAQKFPQSLVGSEVPSKCTRVLMGLPGGAWEK